MEYFIKTKRFFTFYLKSGGGILLNINILTSYQPMVLKYFRNLYTHVSKI